jgi:hypothetical protein
LYPDLEYDSNHSIEVKEEGISAQESENDSEFLPRPEDGDEDDEGSGQIIEDEE